MDLRLTAADEAMLRKMDAAFAPGARRPVVDFEAHARVMDAAAYAVGRGDRMERHCRRLRAYCRRLRRAKAGWECAALLLGAAAGILAIKFVEAVGW